MLIGAVRDDLAKAIQAWQNPWNAWHVYKFPVGAPLAPALVIGNPTVDSTQGSMAGQRLQTWEINAHHGPVNTENQAAADSFIESGLFDELSSQTGRSWQRLQVISVGPTQLDENGLTTPIQIEIMA